MLVWLFFLQSCRELKDVKDYQVSLERQEERWTYTYTLCVLTVGWHTRHIIMPVCFPANMYILWACMSYMWVPLHCNHIHTILNHYTYTFYSSYDALLWLAGSAWRAWQQRFARIQRRERRRSKLKQQLKFCSILDKRSLFTYHAIKARHLLSGSAFYWLGQVHPNREWDCMFLVELRLVVENKPNFRVSYLYTSVKLLNNCTILYWLSNRVHRVVRVFQVQLVYRELTEKM